MRQLKRTTCQQLPYRFAEVPGSAPRSIWITDTPRDALLVVSDARGQTPRVIGTGSPGHDVFRLAPHEYGPQHLLMPRKAAWVEDQAHQPRAFVV